MSTFGVFKQMEVTHQRIRMSELRDMMLQREPHAPKCPQNALKWYSNLAITKYVSCSSADQDPEVSIRQLTRGNLCGTS